MCHPPRFGSIDTCKGTPSPSGSTWEKTNGDAWNGDAHTPTNRSKNCTKSSYVEMGGSATHEKSSEEGIPKTFVHDFEIYLHFTIRSDSATTAEGTNEDK